MNINNTLYPLPASYSGLSRLQNQFNTLQQQLGTGAKAATLADLGSNRYTALTVRARLTRLTGYDANIQTVNLRLGMMNQALGSISAINVSARAGQTVGAYGTNNINLATGPSNAAQQLDQVLTSLNVDINGHYMFGGGVVDRPPVGSTDEIINGSPGKAGFKQIVAERLAADQGTAGTGRVTLTAGLPGSGSVTLAQDNVNFGLKLGAPTTASPGITAPAPTGTPPATTLALDPALLQDGDTVSLPLTLPDGTMTAVTMTAVTGTPANPGEFQIGADADTTAANFATALTGSLSGIASGAEFTAASTYAAADDFFSGQGGEVKRIALPPGGSYGDATGYEPDSTGNTVQWYRGENSANALATVTSKVDDSIQVSYGAQANQGGFLALVKSLAVQSIQTYPTDTDAATAASKQRYDAVADRQITRLSANNDGQAGSIAAIGVTLGLAQTTLKDLSSRHSAYSAQLQDVVGNIENADPTAVASALLELQTRLSASYSAVAMISQLQLANYLK